MRRVKAFECVWVVGGKDETPCAVAIMCNCRRENLISLVLVLGHTQLRTFVRHFIVPSVLSGSLAGSLRRLSLVAPVPPWPAAAKWVQDMRCHFQDTPRAGQGQDQGGRWGANSDGQNCARAPPALHCLAQDTLLFPAKLLRPTAISCEIELRSQACKRCYFI